MIKAGVVIVTEFTEPGGDIYQGYINYMDRSEAIRNEYISEYNLFQDYMGNPDKTTGLFTQDKDVLSQAEKFKYKNVFMQAQKEGSLMWQTVISFDNKWLGKNGVYDSKSGILDEKKIREVTRASMSMLLQKEEMHNAVWTAAIHYNTDNIHIHLATVDPMLERKTKMRNGVETYVGRMKLSSIEAAKSKVVNQIVMQRETNMQINKLIRENIVQAKRGSSLINDRDLADNFLSIYESLPDNKRLWKYNNSVLKGLRPQIDELSKQYIEKYHKDDFKELSGILRRIEALYKEAYGGKKNEFMKNKLQDLYARMGNAILEEMRKFDQTTGYRNQQHKAVPEFEWKENSGDVFLPNEIPDLSEREEQLEFDVPGEEQFKELEPEDEAFAYEFQEEDREKRSRLEEIPEGSIFIDTNDYLSYIEWTPAYKNAKKNIYSENPDYDRARIGLEEEAAKGNVLAVYDLGIMYEKGQGVEINIEKAKVYYKQALQGFINVKLNNEFERKYCSYRLGKMFYYGQGTEIDYEKSFKHLLEAAISGNQYAQYNVANMYYEGKGVDRNYEEAIFWYRNSAEQHNAYSAYRLGEIYKKGVGIDLDLEQSKNFYKQAFKDFMEMEKKGGDDKTEYRIGYMYHYGIGTKIDDKQAEYYLRRSMEAGNIHAQVLLANIYIKTNEPDKKIEAEELLKKAAEAGNEPALYNLGKLYLKENRVKEAVPYLEKSAESENEFAQYTLGKLYMKESREVKRDVRKGIDYLERSAEQGNQYAQYTLGKIYLDGKETTKDVQKGMDYLERSAEQGNQYAQYTLGKIYLDGKETTKDVQKGIDYLERSAEQGNQYAQYRLGKMYFSGEEIIKDLKKAKNYLEAAAEQGNQHAQYALGNLYLNSEAHIKDVRKGIGYLKDAAEQGNQYAQYVLGDLYLNGMEGTGKDVQKGVGYLKDAANKGNQYAQYILGDLYLNGKEGIAKDVWKGVSYLERSVDQGNQYAQYALGKLYLNGDQGIEKDVKKAVGYLDAAANQGNQYAQYTLGKLYWYGDEGINPDQGKAEEYLKQSADQGNEQAKAFIERDKKRMRGRHTVSRQFMNALDQSIRQLKRSMNKEVQSMKNQMQYEQMMWEIENEKNQEV
jgi:TPR repeat protein